MATYCIINYDHAPVSGIQRTYGLPGIQQTYGLASNDNLELMCDM